MDAIAAVLTSYTMQAATLAADVGASMTRRALDEMRTQATLLIDATPPPPPLTTKGVALDVSA